MLESLSPTPVFLKTSKSNDGKNYFINASRVQSIESNKSEDSSKVQYTIKNSFGEEESRKATVKNDEIYNKIGLNVLA